MWISIEANIGAGKSTLLKILSRITEPTHGRINIKGRLTSLLEVGTGFHPELTGRENIYLNGAILGMNRKEINMKFNEIVDFSEIEQFLDIPVKRYSSGMYMRLGFSIAAHLQSDILIIDEVLSVGDIQFQAKCLKKINELGGNGKTIIFVSHDIRSMLSLCTKGVYLDKGQVISSGSIEACVHSYMRNSKDRSSSWTGDIGDEHIRLYNVSLAHNKEFFTPSEKLIIQIDYEILKPNEDLSLGIEVWNTRYNLLANSKTSDSKENKEFFLQKERQKLCFALEASLFHEGEYLIKLNSTLFNTKIIDSEAIVLKFSVFPENKNNCLEYYQKNEGLTLGKNWHLST